MNQAIQKAETHDVSVPQVSPSQVLEVIGRAASDPNIDIDKFERLMQMHERMAMKQAEGAFNAAMSAAQAEIGRVAADSENKQTRSWYASYAALDRKLRPVYTKHGFALSFDEGEAPQPEYVRVLCHVSHAAGFSRTYKKDMPADGKGAKGGDVMTKTHAAGSAQQYGMRYLLKGIFNVAIGNDPDDDDGNDAGRTPITEDQAIEINDLIKEIKLPEARKKAFLKWAKAKSVEEISSAIYADAIRHLKELRDETT